MRWMRKGTLACDWAARFDFSHRLLARNLFKTDRHPPHRLPSKFADRNQPLRFAKPSPVAESTQGVASAGLAAGTSPPPTPVAAGRLNDYFSRRRGGRRLGGGLALPDCRRLEFRVARGGLAPHRPLHPRQSCRARVDRQRDHSRGRRSRRGVGIVQQRRRQQFFFDRGRTPGRRRAGERFDVLCRAKRQPGTKDRSRGNGVQAGRRRRTRGNRWLRLGYDERQQARHEGAPAADRKDDRRAGAGLARGRGFIAGRVPGRSTPECKDVWHEPRRRAVGASGDGRRAFATTGRARRVSRRDGAADR